MTRFAPQRLPELNVFGFGALLNHPWEFLQAPLFRGMADARHWDAVKVCTVAALADGAILVAAFWAVAAMRRSRRWWVQPSTRDVLVFLASGLLITIVGERLAAGPLGVWAYGDRMPTLAGVGLAPLLQWLVLPPVVLWVVRRQLT